MIESHEDLKQANQRLEFLNQFAKDAAIILGLNPRLDLICHRTMDIMRVKGVDIRLLDERTNSLELTSCCGVNKDCVSQSSVDAERGMKKALEGEPQFIPDGSTDSLIQYPDEACKDDIVSMLFIPLEGREKIIGILGLYMSEKKSFTKDDLHFLLALCRQGAIAIENAQIHDTLLSQDESKNEFIMLMTHELKGPLMAVQGLLEVMLKGYVGVLNKKQQELISRIYRRIEALSEVSTGLWDLHQWRSKSRDIEYGPLSMKEQIQNTVDLFKASALQKGLRINLSLPNEELISMGSEQEMEKILNNLITNAIKYTPKGGNISVELSASQKDLILRIQDTGIGIASVNIPKIFDEFFQTKEAKKIDPYGRGLGLPLVRNLVERMGGTIRVNSEKGEGTEFVLIFPRK